MSRSRMTADEKREFVLAYLAVPYGQRFRWLDRQGVKQSQFYSWRRGVLAGELERGLIPRGGVLVNAAENRELARLHAENKKLRRQLEKSSAERAALTTALEVMGKAIECLQDETASRHSQDLTGRR